MTEKTLSHQAAHTHLISQCNKILSDITKDYFSLPTGQSQITTSTSLKLLHNNTCQVPISASSGAFVRQKDCLFRVLNDERGCHGNHSQVKEVVFPSALLQGASKSPIKVVTAVIASSPCPVRSRGRQRRCPINPRSLLLTETLCFTQSHNKSAVPSA